MGQAEHSVLQICQLESRLRQTKEWWRVPHRFRRLYDTFLPENLRHHCREWPASKTESEIKLSLKTNSKPHALIALVAQSSKTSYGKQARCDHNPWRQCSLYGLNLKLDNGEGGSHPCPPLDCLKRWQSEHTCHFPHRFNELATENGMGSPDWNVSVVDIHLRKLLGMPEWREITE